MKTIEEVEHYIKKQAILYFTAEDAESFEIIEFNTFKTILQFAVHEGLKVNGFDFNKILVEPDTDEDDKTTWDYMLELLDILDSMEINKQLPKATAKLYKLWKKSFWEPN